MPQIKTYCRIKPTSSTFEDHDLTDNKLFLRVPEVLKDFSSVRQGSRHTINHEFNFDYIFKQEASQEEVFDVTALEIVKGNDVVACNCRLILSILLKSISCGYAYEDNRAYLENTNFEIH